MEITSGVPRFDPLSYVRSLKETEWVSTFNLTNQQQKNFEVRFGNSIGDNSLYAILPPDEYDSTSWKYLIHKTQPWRILLVFFPDEFCGEAWNKKEAIDYTNQTVSDLLKEIELDRQLKTAIVSWGAHPIKHVINIPFFNYEINAKRYNMPFFISAEIDILNRPVVIPETDMDQTRKLEQRVHAAIDTYLSETTPNAPSFHAN